MGKNKGPQLIDPSLYKQAGIDQKTGLPSRMVENVLMLKNMIFINITIKWART